VNLSKAPGSNRPNKSINSLAFANADSSPFTDFDYEYMKLMANRGTSYWLHARLFATLLFLFSADCGDTRAYFCRLCVCVCLCIVGSMPKWIQLVFGTKDFLIQIPSKIRAVPFRTLSGTLNCFSCCRAYSFFELFNSSSGSCHGRDMTLYTEPHIRPISCHVTSLP